LADAIPTRGDPSTLFERLREYVGAFDPDLFVRAVGATDRDLERYAELSGLGDAIPPAYRSFQLGMGGDDGGLFLDPKIDTKLTSIIELYEESVVSDLDALSAELPVAALFVIGDQISFDCRQRGAEPRLVVSADGTFVGPLACSWEAYVMRAAILRVEPRRLPCARWYSSSPNSAAKALEGASASKVVDAFAAKHGLPIAWPSDDWHRIALGERHSLLTKIGPREDTLLRAFSTDEAFLRRVREELAPLLGATSSGI
jgi:hypothetical protein